MKDGNKLRQKLVGVGKAPPIRAAETPAKPSVVRPIEERETIEIERRGLAEIYIVRAAPYTDRATLPSSQSTAGRPAAIERTAPNDSNGDSPPGLSATPPGALAHTEASQISAESAQQAGPWPEAPPANPAQQAESAGTKTAVRSRKRGIHAKPQQVRARKVLTEIYPNGYPTKDEVPDADLLDEFYKKYEQMIGTDQLRKSKYGPPSPSSVLREAGRKAD